MRTLFSLLVAAGLFFSATLAQAQVISLPTIPAQQSPVGTFDKLEEELTGGWAFDPDRPNEPTWVWVIDQQNTLYFGETTGERPDVDKAYSLTKGKRGWTIRTPEWMKDGNFHLVRMYA